MKESKSRPINLDIHTISFPITAIASILHRVSGVIIFISIGILLWLLSMSLSSSDGFQTAYNIINVFVVKVILWGILTALSYHIIGGIRHLIMDLGYFEEFNSGCYTAKIAFTITVILSILAGVLIW